MKNDIVRRMTALLLTMVCIITTTPEALLTAYADETQIAETEVLEQKETEMEEADYTEESENATEETECVTEQSITTEMAEETEQMETVTEKVESMEQTEIVADNTEGIEQTEASTEETKISEESTQSEVNVQEIETTEIISETESVAENYGIMLLSDGEETITTMDVSYTDANGITYSYYSYEDGTANIYAMADYDGKEVAILSVIDGYAVTQITAQLSYDAQLISLTIPETVTSIGTYCFQVDGIGTLYYNATEVTDVQDVYGAPFVGAAIGNLVI